MMPQHWKEPRSSNSIQTEKISSKISVIISITGSAHLLDKKFKNYIVMDWLDTGHHDHLEHVIIKRDEMNSKLMVPHTSRQISGGIL